MSLARPRPRNLGAGIIGLVDDFMNWLLYGYETWLVALLKGVPLFLYVYFLLTYVPNYVYYGVTQYIPFLKFSPEVGFVIAQGVGIGNMLVLIVFGLWTQAARGRRGFAWSLIRILDFLQMLFVYLLLIPLLAFNMAGGTFVPPEGTNPFPLQALGFGTLVAGLGAASIVYLYFEYRRVIRREAQQATARSAAAYEAG
jgi:hypothetical protein